jgi:dTDP-L-rhamnose 4-epimerase
LACTTILHTHRTQIYNGRSDLRSVLITGGAGFIGTYLTRALHTQVDKIVLLDNLLPQVHQGRTEFPTELRACAVCVVGDVRDPAVWSQIAADHPDIDTIVHLAAMTGTGQSMYALAEYDSVNCGGTAAMLAALLDRRDPTKCLTNVSHVLLASSRAIYGEGAYRATPDAPLVYPPPRTRAQLERHEWDFVDAEGRKLSPVPTPEDAPPQPNSFYGVTKLVQEQYIRTMLTATGIGHTILRFQNVFGPGQSLKNPYTGVIGVFYSNIVGGRPLEIYEDGRVTRDFVYVTDVVAAVTSAILRRSEGTYNVGSGEFTQLADVARWLCTALDRTVPIECRGTFRVGDIRHNAADLRRARLGLGFQPQVSVEEGLRQYVAWAQHETPLNAETIAAATAELRAAGLSQEATDIKHASDV